MLVAGGAAGGSPVAHEDLVDQAEIYDPTTGRFCASECVSGSAGRRIFHSATVLEDGRVLVYGGLGQGGTALEQAVLFYPSTSLFVPLDLDPARGVDR